jgi:pimeloyl-ACP methyl ester carboxylesterase
MEKSIALPTGVTLRYAEQGHASGVPVVFLHGVTDSWRSFEHVFEHLPPTVHAFALSQRGHGDSSRPENGYTFADMSSDLRAFMDAVKLPAAVIVGHSMGASVAQRFAIDHPARAAGLVLIGSFATFYQDPALGEYYATGLSKLRDPIDYGFARDFQTSTLARELPPDQLDTFVKESLKVPSRVWQALFKGFLETPDFSRDLTKVAAPTLLLWGERDSYVPRQHQELIRTLVPRARLVTYAETGHALHWEHPERFTADLIAFVYERQQPATR